jgi:hypothetical protein
VSKNERELCMILAAFFIIIYTLSSNFRPTWNSKIFLAGLYKFLGSVFSDIIKTLSSYVGRTAACVKTCNSQDTISATWRKERSIVETNDIMRTVAHRPEAWCWRQHHAADTCSKTQHVPFLCVKIETSVLKVQHQCTLSTWVKNK